MFARLAPGLLPRGTHRGFARFDLKALGASLIHEALAQLFPDLIPHGF